jgi:hypothetical protein
VHATLPAAGDALSRTPDPSTFESGDLLWPKKPGAFTPYSSNSPGDLDEDEDDWLRERDAFIAKIRTDPAQQELARDLSELSYKEFYLRYARDQDLRGMSLYSSDGGGFSVGHVAIVQLDDEGRPWVIEAMLKDGIIKHLYSEWIDARRDQIVWQGRIGSLAREDRSKFAAESVQYLGRPYNFWNFNLADVSGFYCSKLVWLCAYRTLGVALDGNMQTKRSFWVSPKQLLYSSKIVRLHDPGRYAVD